MVGWGVGAPRIVSPDQGSGDAVALADLIGVDEPIGSLAVVVAQGV